MEQRHGGPQGCRRGPDPRSLFRTELPRARPRPPPNGASGCRGRLCLGASGMKYLLRVLSRMTGESLLPCLGQIAYLVQSGLFHRVSLDVGPQETDGLWARGRVRKRRNCQAPLLGGQGPGGGVTKPGAGLICCPLTASRPTAPSPSRAAQIQVGKPPAPGTHL